MRTEFRIVPGAALRAMLLAIGSLFLLHMVLVFVLKHGLGHDSVYGLVGLFDLLGERNVPTLLSTLLILCCSALLFLIYKGSKSYRLYWFMLSAVFLLLSIDEIAGFHEALSHFRAESDSDNRQFAWAIPYLIAATLLGIIYIPFLMSLAPRFRMLFISSGILYIAAAAGLEIVAGFLNDAGLSFYVVVAGTIEESLEMVAMAIFAYSLLAYLADEPVGPTRLTIDSR